MDRRTLETTPEMCAMALAALTPMEQGMCMEGWLARDAAAAHELLALVRQLAHALALAERTTELTPNTAGPAMDAAAPWLEA